MSDEQTMIEMGRKRYERAAARTRGKDGKGHMAAPENHALRETIQPFRAALDAWIEEATTGPGRNSEAALVLKGLPTDVIAYLAGRRILSMNGGDITLAKAAFAVGREIEDEFRYRSYKQADKFRFAELLRRSRSMGYAAMRKRIHKAFEHLEQSVDSWGKRMVLRVGVVCLELFMETTGLVEFHTYRTGKNRRRTDLRPTEKFLEWIRESDARLSLMSPVLLPTEHPPKDWIGVFVGGYEDAPVPLISGVDRETLMDIDNEVPDTVLRAVNRLQSVPWRVNTNIQEVAEHYWREGVRAPGIPIEETEPLPPRPERGDVTPEAAQARADRLEIGTRNRQAVGQRIGAGWVLSLAAKYDGEFYHPHKLDFRGRMYPMTSTLSVQGSDLSRGLIEFAEERPLGDTGLLWMKIHGANVWGEDKVSLVERVMWVDRHEEQIESVALDPLDDLWWQEADEPWQFLAFCLAYSEAKESGVSRLPIQIDGSNNGLQVFSLLLRDEMGANATNCTPASPADTPRDIYTDVAEITEVPPVLAHVLGPEGLPRKAVKRQTMTLPYGATRRSASEYTRAWFHDAYGYPLAPWESKKQQTGELFALSDSILESIKSHVPGAVGCMDWLRALVEPFVKANIPIKWHAPSGFPIIQRYRRYKVREVRTVLGSKIRWTKFREDQSKLDRRKSTNAISPNFVHGIDASALVAFLNHTTFPVGTVHDAIMVHPGSMVEAAQAIRRAYVSTLRGDLLNELREELQEQVPDTELPPAPELGDLDINGVLASTYFFS